MTYVAQWNNYRWVNFYDEDGNTRYFESIEDAKAFLATRHIVRDVEARVCEYLGGRSYKEVEAPRLLRKFK